MAEKDTSTRILDTAQELIQRLGANAMSYQHISDAVGIRKASIHHHFPTKENLIEVLLERYNRYFLALVDNLFDSDIPPLEKLRQYIGLFESTLSSDHCDKACMCGMLGAEISTLGTQSAAMIKSFYEENERRLARVLDEGRRAGAFTFKGDATATASLVFSLLEGSMLIARAKDGVAHFRKVSGQLEQLLAG